MPDDPYLEPLLARCIVCRGDIHANDPHELWEEAYYCEVHSLPRLRARAAQYAEVLRAQQQRRSDATH